MSYIGSIVNKIPSVLLRKHLTENQPQWTLLQWASVAAIFMRPKAQATMFTKMLPLAETSYEKALLQAAIQDISNDGYVGQLSQNIYDAEHQGSDSPAFPFLERCFLPILLKKGDLAKTRRGSKTEAFLVRSTPENLPECSDLTDECYYCYSLNCNVPEDLFLIHEHIHICFADACSESELSDSQKAALSAIRQQLVETERNCKTTCDCGRDKAK